MSQRKLGLPAAADERHDAIADREAFDVAAECDHLAGELHARDVRRAAGWRRVQTAPLQHVGAVQTGGAHLDQQLARAGLRIGVLPPLQAPVDHRHGPHRHLGAVAGSGYAAAVGEAAAAALAP